MDRVRALNDDDAAFERWYGPWTPLTPPGVADLLVGVAVRWWIVGGWAIDAFTGRPRDHHDIDVGFFRADLAAHARPPRAGRLRLVERERHPPAADAAPDDLLPDCRQLWVRRDGESPWILDLAMTPHDGTTWISPRDEAIRLPIDEATFVAAVTACATCGRRSS